MLRTERLRWLQRCSAAPLALLACAACASDEPEELSPPDLMPLVQAYAYPSAQLEQAEVQQLVTAAQPMLSAASAASGFDFIVSSIESAKAGLEARGLDSAPDVDGTVTIHSICPGFFEQDVPDDTRDGFIELQVAIDDDALGPVAFGRAEHCRSQDPPRRSQLDGPIAIHFGAPLVLGSPIAATPIVRIDGVLAVEGLPSLTAFDVRLPAPGVTEARIVLPSGETAVLAVAGTSFSVRERRGTWQCTTAGGMTCVAGF